MKQISPIEFFKHLSWLDGRPLLDSMEPYRQRMFMEALYTFDANGHLLFNRVLSGRAKKNYKTTDLVLASLYRLLGWHSKQGNDGSIIANDEDQANDDLDLAKKLVAINPILAREVIVKQKEIERRDGRGSLLISQHNTRRPIITPHTAHVWHGSRI